ncbi:hypothetical protein EEZ25_32970 [Micromonospora aurantiaca]|nr:hypothetical protein EEZ25_32970 [Micromonospora aurantiaca]
MYASASSATEAQSALAAISLDHLAFGAEDSATDLAWADQRCRIFLATSTSACRRTIACTSS